MQIQVLGSGAGGGFPQWNCNCDNCAGIRAQTNQAQARTQSSIALSDDHGEHWVLMNASPDIRAQLAATPQLLPQGGRRGTPICAVMLVDAQIDHTSGLLFLREGERLPIYCTEAVYEDLTTGFPVLNLLQHYCGIDHHVLPFDGQTPVVVPQLPNIEFTAIALDGKAPPYSPHRANPQPGDNIAFKITDITTGQSVFYAPGLARIDTHVQTNLESADLILVDGTFWTEDEMILQGVGTKMAAEMGHLPQSGPNGMVERLGAYTDKRKVLIHINNTNPILDERSEQRRVLEEHGIEVAYDGMHLTLNQ